MIRHFWLTNEKGEEFDLRPRGNAMLSNPKGTAEGVGQRSYWQGTRAFEKTNYRDSQSTITGTINFTKPHHFNEFEQYIATSEELYLHVVRDRVAERYCKVDCAITDRPEDFAGWVLATVSFRRLNAWRNPGKREIKTISAQTNVSMASVADGSLPSAFVLRITPSSTFTGAVTVTSGAKTFALSSLTIASSKTLAITSVEGEQSVYNDASDVYNKILFSTSSFFEIDPGSGISIHFSASFTGKVELEIFDQWNEA